jgi:hypothetical protein
METLNVVLETIKETFTPAPAAPAAGSHEASEDEAKKKSILGRIIQGVKETVLGESHLQPGGQDEKMDRDRASDIIQRAVKRYMFRTRLRKAKTGKATMDRERAGVEIHNAAKRYLFRSNLSYRKVEKKAGADTKEKERLSSLVGAAACSWLAKKDFRSSRKSQSKGWNNDKDRLASQIGAASRTWLAKQKLSSSSFKETKPKEKRGKENVRPEVIQSAARGYLAKQQLKRTGKSENVSDPAKVPEILKMVEVVEKALENIDESQLPKATKADLFTPSSQEPAPSQRLHPLPTVDARPNVATGNTQSRFQPERSSN